MTVSAGPPAVTFEAAQHALAVVAANSRGDFAAAEELLRQFDSEECKSSGFFMACQLSIRMLAQALDEPVDKCASDLAVALAAAALSGAPPDPG
ncbi:MAG TPA: hypothetical protein VMH41_16295 [Mycobacteriales bacterium]|nr:hypothetical protein [Mycobacteriales bacterium]